MHLASVPPRGITTIAVSAAILAACSLWWLNWSQRNLSPLLTSELAPPTTDAHEPVGTAGVARRSSAENWFTSLFAQPRKDARQQAVAQLETFGAPLTGDAFVRAVATRHRPLIDLFLQAGMDVNAPGAQGRTALLTAALGQDWNLMHQLLAAGADPNRADAHGLTPLMAAAMSDQTGAARALLGRGAVLDPMDERSHTALHYAVAARSLGTMRLLLDAGAPCTNLQCCDGHDLLAHAFDSRDWRIIEPILTRQPEKLMWTPATRTALTQAVAARDSARTRLLLSKHPAAPTPEGKAQPMLAYALLEGDISQFQFLLDCGASPDTPLNSPVEKSFSQMVPQKFLRHYLDTEGGMTTLMLAAGMGRTDFIQALLEKGATRGAGTSKSRMPASVFAARADNPAALQMLFDRAPKPEELRIQISLGGQRATLFKNGMPVMSTGISSGRSGFATPPGDYVVTDKHVSHISTIYKVPMPWFMRLSYRDFGMHQGVVPGYPASHGCIRVPSGTARKLFQSVPVGTLVSIRN
jgi:ankyrin repeat protein